MERVGELGTGHSGCHDQDGANPAGSNVLLFQPIQWRVPDVDSLVVSPAPVRTIWMPEVSSCWRYCDGEIRLQYRSHSLGYVFYYRSSISTGLEGAN